MQSRPVSGWGARGRRRRGRRTPGHGPRPHRPPRRWRRPRTRAGAKSVGADGAPAPRTCRTDSRSAALSRARPGDSSGISTTDSASTTVRVKRSSTRTDGGQMCSCAALMACAHAVLGDVLGRAEVGQAQVQPLRRDRVEGVDAGARACWTCCARPCSADSPSKVRCHASIAGVRAPPRPQPPVVAHLRGSGRTRSACSAVAPLGLQLAADDARRRCARRPRRSARRTRRSPGRHRRPCLPAARTWPPGRR